MLIGDLNLNTKSKNNGYYSGLCDTFDLTNLIKANTCFKSSNQTSIDVILINRPNSFQKSGVITTGISDCHKMIVTFFRSYFSRLPPKTITYRSFRYFGTKDFLYELENKLRTKECNGGVEYDDLTNIFRSTLESHAPLKQKQVRGNQALFMTKELSKAVMTRSRIKNKYNKWPSRENFLALKQIKNKCTNQTKTAKKQYFAKSAENQPLTNKSFWNSKSPFVTNKNVRNYDVITLKEKGRLINDELYKNSHYKNIVETTCGQPPRVLGNPKDQANDLALVDAIITNYKHHPSINQI